MHVLTRESKKTHNLWLGDTKSFSFGCRHFHEISFLNGRDQWKKNDLKEFLFTKTWHFDFYYVVFFSVLTLIYPSHCHIPDFFAQS